MPNTITINKANNLAIVNTFWMRMAPRTLHAFIAVKKPIQI